MTLFFSCVLSCQLPSLSPTLPKSYLMFGVKINTYIQDIEKYQCVRIVKAYILAFNIDIYLEEIDYSRLLWL